MNDKILRRAKIKEHIRTKLSGTATCPRMTVFRSNSQIYVQLIDDTKGVTLGSASSVGIKEKLTKSAKATQVGKDIASVAQKAGISTIVFDRNGYLYHGRVKCLADAAREAGLKF